MTVDPIFRSLPYFVLNLSIQCVLLFSLCALSLWIFRRGSAPIRYTIVRATVVLMIALPFGSVLAPMIPVSFPLEQQLPQRLRWATGFVEPKPQGRSAVGSTPGTALTPDADHPKTTWIRWDIAFSVIYVTVLAIFTGRIIVGHFLMRAKVHTMVPLRHKAFIASVDCQCRRLKITKRPDLRSSSHVFVPMTFGWLKPVVLLPVTWAEWSQQDLDMILAHELSHIGRNDYLFRLLSTLNKAIYWFHPASWWLDRRLSELAEYLSDDAALQLCIDDRQAYAAVISRFTQSLDRLGHGFRLGIAMALSRRGHARIDRILDTARWPSLSLRPSERLLIFVSSTALFLVLASAQADNRVSLHFIQDAAVSEAGVANERLLQHTQRTISPSRFSAVYLEAIRQGSELDSSSAMNLRVRLARNPADSGARIALVAYDTRADRSRLLQSRKERVALLLWLMEHHPDSELLGSPYAQSLGVDLEPGPRQRAESLWRSIISDHPTSAGVLWNASLFYRSIDQHLSENYLARAVDRAPNNRDYGENLGIVYGRAILSTSPGVLYNDIHEAAVSFSAYAAGQLNSTRNAFVLEGAVRVLQSEYNASLIRGASNTAVGTLAKRYFVRAQNLDPDVDVSWVYPHLEAGMAGKLTLR